MEILALIRDRFRSLVMSEHGMALPVALLTTIASLGLASAAVMSSVNAQQGSSRDSSSKNAIAAADAGASIALMRLNRYASALKPSAPCLSLSGATLVTSSVAADGWCPEVKGTVGSSSYAYRITPQVTGSTMSVVAAGTSGTVSRRVDVTFKSTTVGSALNTEGLIGQDSITTSGNADIRVGIGTNGDVGTSGSSNICGNIRHGIGKKYTGNGQCNGYEVTEGNVTLPAVSSFMPSDIATNNSDFRLETCTKITPPKTPTGCQLDTFSGTWSAGSPYDPATKSISLSSGLLTLGGGDYWLCSLTLNGSSELIMADKGQETVRIFFDTPENCGIKSGGSQISMNGNNRIAATGYQPSLNQFAVPGFYLQGSTTIPTTVNLSGNNSTTNEFVIYAPNTAISIKGNATFKGVIAGKSIDITGSAVIKQDSGFEAPQTGGATVYQRQSYVECTGASASPPNAYC
jgi:hypothetical protein